MNKNWTFGRKLAFGFTISSIFLVIVGVVGYWSSYALIETSYSVAHTHKVIEQIIAYLSTMKDAETGQRGYLLTGDPTYLEPHTAAVETMPKLITELRTLTADSPNQQRRLEQMESITSLKLGELQKTIDLRQAGHGDEAIKFVLTNQGKIHMDQIRKLADEMLQEERTLLDKRATEAESTVNTAKNTIIAGTLICMLFVAITGIVMARSLATQLGAAVGHVQSSSAELQAAASQQATGAREQAGAMNEISTTISELGVTSRQIAESAQRVAQIAEQTASAARSGEGTVERGQEAMIGIRRQIDQVVTHMLDLGRKSQEIGAVLDIVSELAEQTNILAINATIEATGAGESGKRFSVVAE